MRARREAPLDASELASYLCRARRSGARSLLKLHKLARALVASLFAQARAQAFNAVTQFFILTLGRCVLFFNNKRLRRKVHALAPKIFAVAFGKRARERLCLLDLFYLPGQKFKMRREFAP